MAPDEFKNSQTYGIDVLMGDGDRELAEKIKVLVKSNRGLLRAVQILFIMNEITNRTQHPYCFTKINEKWIWST